MAAVDDLTAQALKPDAEEMLRLLVSPELSERMVAARAFCELQEERAIPHLIKLLSDACPLLRVSAAYALGRNPREDAVEPLIYQFAQDWNGYVRKGVVWALGNCRDRRALPSLLDALSTDISAVRLWAASSLGQLANLSDEINETVIPAIIQAMSTEPLGPIRSNCVWSLGQLSQSLPQGKPYQTAIATLIQALQDPDLGVQEDAKIALQRLGDPQGLKAIEELDSIG
ncbi:MAG: HEAT repeat domain-containing protein [Acaryochloridaceae cyanobacterium SU_2_1]|nr:HEAT repeat domain-containing protein [Acaryochloridaceae cyanobacterium SU_2_1]